MKELYYSETLKKTFDTKEECLAKEKEFELAHAEELRAKEERSRRAKEINEAYKNYLELRNKFIEDYGEYHLTLTDKDIPSFDNSYIWDMFNDFFGYGR